jgi:hypothetical protein
MDVRWVVVGWAEARKKEVVTPFPNTTVADDFKANERASLRAAGLTAIAQG